ncbi:MAG: periplasmic heavy metal sensor [Polyangiaceae bacterium]
MFGFVFGIVCLWGLVRVVRGGRRYGWGSCDGGHRMGRGRWRRGWGGEDRRWRFLRGVFEELDTTPGQEKEIRAAIEEVMDAGGKLKAGFSDTRSELGKVFRSEELDETILGTVLSHQDAALDEMRGAMVGALARIHAALDPEQRARLARWLERGSRFGRHGWGGPYRAHA